MKTAMDRAQELLTALGVAWSSDTTRNIAHGVCMNTPFPGEGG